MLLSDEESAESECYHGFTFHLRGEADGHYGLSTDKPLPVEGLEMIERGVYGISVPCSEEATLGKLSLASNKTHTFLL
ncbi:MAG: hypothetical protein SPE04_09165 [Prevotella sp.]|nr:hypothetical protein [Bacteroidales bacterium]MDY4499723.1 hypothetical protein [Prevotella sp.]